MVTVRTRDLMRGLHFLLTPRAASNELNMECTRLAEEMDIVRLELMYSQQQKDEVLRRAAAVQGAATSALASPMVAAAARRSSIEPLSKIDDTDRDVEDVMQQFAMMNSSGTAAEGAAGKIRLYF